MQSLNSLTKRVTGVLMFDSELFLHIALKRVDNWEIHPVTKQEFCEPAWEARHISRIQE